MKKTIVTTDYTKNDDLNPVQCVYHFNFGDGYPQVVLKYSTATAIRNFVIPMDSKNCVPFYGADLKKENLIELQEWLNKALEYYE